MLPKPLRKLLWLLFFSAWSLPLTASHLDTAFVAYLNGLQEVPTVPTSGHGFVNLTLDGTDLIVSGSFDDLSSKFDPNVAGGSHLHIGYAGQNGGIAFTLVPTLGTDSTGGTFDAALNTFTLTPGQIEQLRDRQYYVNIHTHAFAGGEIRGQVLPEADAHYQAYLSSSQEGVPAVSAASGMLMMELKGSELYVSGSFMGLESDFNTAIAGGAHLHLGLAGQSGGVDLILNSETDMDLRGGVFLADSNEFTLDATQIQALEDRRYYANLHSMDLPGGEIRGQVIGMANRLYRAFLSGHHEALPVVSTGIGQVLLESYPDSTLIVSGSFENLTSEFDVNIAGGAHLHFGLAGSNGGIAQGLMASLAMDNLSGTFPASMNTYMANAALMEALENRGVYVNLHSQAFPGGELRGQALPAANYYFQAFLSGTQSATPVNSGGHGAVALEVRGDQWVVSGSYADLDSDIDLNIAGGAHLHLAPAGANGPISLVLAPTPDPDATQGSFFATDNMFTVSAGQQDSLRGRMVYLNLHTTGVASGEIRGQMLGEATTAFVAPLSGSSQVPALDRSATGTVIGELLGDQLMVSGSFQGLGSDLNTAIAGGVHIHAGFPGQNGPVILVIDSDLSSDNRSGTFPVMTNQFELSSGKIDTMLARGYYVNVHSMDDASGEIRGSLLAPATSYHTTTLAGMNEVPPVLSNGSGALKLELSGDAITVVGAFADLDGDYDSGIGSHLHLAEAGMNGGVEVFLTPELDNDLRGGVFRADSNQVDLSEAQTDALRSGNLYANIHTTAVASGELRGQVLAESNFFPQDAPEIANPMTGIVADITGDGSQMFMADWSASTEPDMNTLVYRWQLATDDSFSMPLVDSYVTMPMFSTTFDVVDSILAGAGVMAGDTVMVYHRAIATDGAVSTVGMTDSLMLVRSGITSINDALSDHLQLQARPNPVQNRLQLALTSDLRGQARVVVFSMQGAIVSEQIVDLRPGSQTLELNSRDWSAGLYQVQLITPQGTIPAMKILKQ